jgi:hypothetical protein
MSKVIISVRPSVYWVPKLDLVELFDEDDGEEEVIAKGFTHIVRYGGMTDVIFKGRPKLGKINYMGADGLPTDACAISNGEGPGGYYILALDVNK